MRRILPCEKYYSVIEARYHNMRLKHIYETCKYAGWLILLELALYFVYGTIAPRIAS